MELLQTFRQQRGKRGKCVQLTLPWQQYTIDRPASNKVHSDEADSVDYVRSFVDAVCLWNHRIITTVLRLGLCENVRTIHVLW